MRSYIAFLPKKAKIIETECVPNALNILVWLQYERLNKMKKHDSETELILEPKFQSQQALNSRALNPLCIDK